MTVHVTAIEGAGIYDHIHYCTDGSIKDSNSGQPGPQLTMSTSSQQTVAPKFCLL